MRVKLFFLFFMGLAMASSRDVGSTRLSTDIIKRYRSFKDSADTTNHQTDPNHPPSTIHENMPSRRKRSISTSSSALSRLIRSSNAIPFSDATFSTLQSRVAALARVVTGVSLYNGLVDKSISSDQAITELMNLGSIQLKDLETFDNKKVDEFAKKLKEASNKMKTEAEETEQRMVDLHTMKVLWSESGDLKTIPDKSRFDGLKFLETLDLKVLEDFKLGTDSQKSLESLRSAAKSAVDAIGKTDALKTLKDMMTFHRFAQLVDYYFNSDVINMKSLEPSTSQSVKDDLTKLQDLAVGTDSVFLAMKEIVSSSKGNKNARQHTSGFINGYNDLMQVSKDSGDSWLQKALGSFVVADELSIFKEVEKEMKSLDNVWNSARKDTIKLSLHQAEQLETNAKTIKYESSAFDTMISSFQKCSFPANMKDYKNKLVALSNGLKKINSKIETIYSISRFTEGRNGNASETLNYLKPHLQALNHGQKVNAMAIEIMTKSDFYGGIPKNSVATDHEKFFNCLKDIKEDSAGFSAPAQLALDIRQLKNSPTFETDITTASFAVSGSSKHISTIRSKIEEITKLETGKKLVGLKELVKFSKPLGDSSEALSRVQKVLERKKALLDFVEKGHVVEEAVELLPAAWQQFEVRKGWAGFDELSSQILNQLDKMQKWIDGLGTSEELDSYGSALEKLSGLGDVDLEMNRRLAAVDFLQQQIIRFNLQSPEIVKFKETISPLESLNLEFSKFDASLSTMSSTLTGLKNVGGKAVNSTTMAAGLIGEKEGSDNFWYIVSGVVAVVVIVALIIAGIVCGWFKACLNKMKGKPKPTNKTTPPAPPNPKPITPVTPDDQKVVPKVHPPVVVQPVAPPVAPPAGNNRNRRNNQNDQAPVVVQPGGNNRAQRNNQNDQAIVAPPGGNNRAQQNNQNNQAPVVVQPGGNNQNRRNNQNDQAPVVVQPGEIVVPPNEYSARPHSSYMDSQSDDDTLRCVKSITNNWC
ncbi:hypothetical protein CRE_12233 [Caenorhabditis remanei]|uniref:Domain of unknown function WSN domain-containing protein n=1 Tax=Caenorhabditis remanei TaxID=31234 RepID=E3N6Z6_CAERE|nr:hypothetical protein CRE_12233 [Caenorhabditis remanei]